MQVPDAPVPHTDEESLGISREVGFNGQSSEPNATGDSPTTISGNKRQRTGDSPEVFQKVPVKHRILRPSRSNPLREVSPHTASLKTTVSQVEGMTGGIEGCGAPSATANAAEVLLEASDQGSAITPGMRQTNLRQLLHVIINESLRMGGRPESAFTRKTDGGELIEVKIRTSEGRLLDKTIDWCVNRDIPETLLLDERDLAKLISCVFLNAVKFTEEGKISLSASLTSKGKMVSIL